MECLETYKGHVLINSMEPCVLMLNQLYHLFRAAWTREMSRSSNKPTTHLSIVIQLNSHVLSMLWTCYDGVLRQRDLIEHDKGSTEIIFL